MDAILCMGTFLECMPNLRHATSNPLHPLRYKVCVSLMRTLDFPNTLQQKEVHLLWPREESKMPKCYHHNLQHSKIINPQVLRIQTQKKVVQNPLYFHNTKLHSREMKTNLVHKKMMQSQAPRRNRLSLHDKKTGQSFTQENGATTSTTKNRIPKGN